MLPGRARTPRFDDCCLYHTALKAIHMFLCLVYADTFVFLYFPHFRENFQKEFALDTPKMFQKVNVCLQTSLDYLSGHN